MTIFFKVATHLLVEEIEGLKVSSINADQTLVNKALTAAGLGRDTSLSEAKREQLNQLIAAIKAVKEGENDEASCCLLHQAIDEQLNTIDALCVQHGFDTAGETGRGLQGLKQFITKLHQKIRPFGVENTPYDQSPLQMFRYYLSCYLAKKEVNKLSAERTLLGRFAVNPKISSISQRMVEKQQLLLTHYKACVTDLDALDKAHPRYAITCCDRVLENLNKLIDANKLLCEAHAGGFGFFQPALGDLHECMESAKKEIVAIKELLVSSVEAETSLSRS